MSCLFLINKLLHQIKHNQLQLVYLEVELLLHQLEELLDCLEDSLKLISNHNKLKVSLVNRLCFHNPLLAHKLKILQVFSSNHCNPKIKLINNVSKK